MDQYWTEFQSMPDLEAQALRRCAQCRMSYDEDLEEIGSSDINCEAVCMLRNGEWPSPEERGEIGLGFLVEEFSNDLGLFPAGACFHSPSDTLKRVKRDGSYEDAMPDILYRGKHLLSKEDSDLYSKGKEMFAE